MRKLLVRTLKLTVCTFVMLGAAQIATAQNMQHTVVTKDVRFARGKHQTSLRGSAKYGMSYVFNLRAKQGQTMDIRLTGKNSQLGFSLIAPDDETIEGAFGVANWSGVLPQSGKYSIVVVMNDEKSARVPYALAVTIK